MSKKVILRLITIIIPIIILSIFLFNPYFIRAFNKKVIILGLFILTSILINLLYKFRKPFIYKLLTIIQVLSCFALLIGCILNYFNLMYIFTSIANLKNFILSTGKKGMLLYIIIQMAQVIFLPIPAGVITLAGVAIWGPLLGGLLDSIGVLLGSYFSFFLGRTFGFRLVSWVTGKEKALKYAKIINDRGKFFLFYAFLLPFFPDDILCLISGITTMSFKYFFIVSLITRPVGVMFMSYFGGGYIIPFSGWGIYVWIILAIFIVISIYFLTKYQDKIEQKTLNLLFSKKRKRKTLS